ncbi:hypothetical protein B0T25DRAFT_457629 [Lasiosphaeria hispida]|uniref:Uncharacterized protein n=1 Tax=Lasiosphaeria hispida TaxID=260671 RepID=A0AAJ0MBU8_9PEZI|nr:hypothetical protein B0T25DRAFT_457629 [Lasiosphaeria hispida]
MSEPPRSNATHIACFSQVWLVGDPTFITTKEWSCKNFSLCDCPPLEADPDIAGVGVIFAFAFSASLTLVATIICLMLCRSNLRPFTVNPLDQFFRNIFCEPLQKRLRHQRTRRWANVCYDMVVCLSDQQLVTGIAMMIAGLKKLHDESITVYHLSIVTDLVWFSSNTHLTSLLVISYFSVESFKEDAPARIIPTSTQLILEPRKKFVARLPRVARAVLMVFLACLLAYATLITGYVYWPETFNCPVSCTIGLPRGGEPQRWMIVNIVLIFYAYPKSIFSIWHGGRRVWFEQWRSTIVDNRHLGQSEPPRHWVIKSARRMYHCLWYYFASDTGDIAMENSWGFGQLVPIVLLLLPALQLLESIAGKDFMSWEVD